MCGIVGYIGKKDVAQILIQGLEFLEYRGYDSAGISVFNPQGNFLTVKQNGKIAELSKTLSGKEIKGSMGIGHTRWATHGKPSNENAHPHVGSHGTVVLVHNGIIENFYELKVYLIDKGREFSSDTDSEVIANLIEDVLQDTKMSFIEAIRSALKKVRGTYALGLMHKDHPESLYAIRSGSPLVVGLGENENFMASDVTALLKHTRRVVYLEDDQIAVLRNDSVEILNLDGSSVPLNIHEVEWKLEEAEKGGFETFMLKEIHEQPEILSQVLMGRIQRAEAKIEFKELEITVQELKKIKRLILVGCGSAYHAGLCGKYILERYTSIPVEVELGSEFRYRNMQVQPGTLVVAISQSGETADTLASVRKAKELGCDVLSIVNVIGSTLTRESKGVIYTQAGPEIGVASTKAYLAQLTIFYLLSLYLGRLREEMDIETAQGMIEELYKIPQKIQTILSNQKLIIQCARKYCASHSMFYLGRGFNYPTALEGALKNKEISYMHAEAYAAGEMKHGPIAMIDESFPVVIICTQGSIYEKVNSNLREIEARNGKIIALVNPGDKLIHGDDIIEVPETLEELSPLVNVVCLQLLAYYFALNRGCDIDKPRNLAKSVTVE